MNTWPRCWDALQAAPQGRGGGRGGVVTHGAHTWLCCMHSALQGLLRKLGAGLDDVFPGVARMDGSRFRVGAVHVGWCYFEWGWC